ncbi:MAG: 16S rRNA (uracil(1498)-N(3))-methyltransferase [Bacteroidales bacterium]|nr:16S rRNA (uracil(1498)-N(3))-methyltransferase [Bacteroidales bacterium]
MNFFYSDDINPPIIILPPDEAHHCLHVLRIRTGDEVMVVDGRGNIYKCVYIHTKGKTCYLEILESTFSAPRPYYLHLAIASLKNHDRMEWLVEKATEVGVDEITFLNTRYTERKLVNFDRLKKIAISAMKQSQKAYLPLIHQQVVAFDKFVESCNTLSQKFIAHCYSNLTERKILGKIYTPQQPALCLIGPEGDFSEEEVKKAIEMGFESVTLGNSRLRAETAALSVCFLLAFINEIHT